MTLIADPSLRIVHPRHRRHAHPVAVRSRSPQADPSLAPALMLALIVLLALLAAIGSALITAL